LFIVISLVAFIFYQNASKAIIDGTLNKALLQATELMKVKVENFNVPLIQTSSNLAISSNNKNWMLKDHESEEGRKLYQQEQEAIIANNGFPSIFQASLLSNTYYTKGVSDGPIDMDGKDSWLMFVINMNAPYGVNMDFDRVSGKLSMFINYKVMDKNKLIGLTGTMVELNSLLEMLSKQKLGERGYFFAISEDGTIQLHKNKDYILRQNQTGC